MLVVSEATEADEGNRHRSPLATALTSAWLFGAALLVPSTGALPEQTSATGLAPHCALPRSHARTGSSASRQRSAPSMPTIPSTKAIPLGNYQRIFVMYPRGDRTGGPEALHQLVHVLRSLGEDAVLFPRPGTEREERSPAYAHYDAPEVALPEDAPGNAIVASEASVLRLAEFKNAQRFCWWLSVDNSPLFMDERRRLDRWDEFGRVSRVGARRRALEAAKSVRRHLRGDWRLLQQVRHLSQSYYAWSFLFSRLGIHATALSDYVDVVPREPAWSAASAEAPAVVFNPKKAPSITKAVERRLGGRARFVPLAGMSSEEVHRAMTAAAVYLDLGYHPGRDRMPREAAMRGAVTLVARRGSGAFHVDVPIPWEHKIEPDASFVDNAVRAIERVFDDPTRNRELQASYREIIAGQRDQFRKEVRSAFVEGRFGSDVV